MFLIMYLKLALHIPSQASELAEQFAVSTEHCFPAYQPIPTLSTKLLILLFDCLFSSKIDLQMSRYVTQFVSDAVML